MTVLYEDAHLLAVDKPSGRLVIPGRIAGETSLREDLAARHGPLWVVHRLDRNTTGVLVFARTADAHRALNLAFDRGEPQKTYLALVRGTPAPEGRIDLALAPGRKGKMRVARPGDVRAKPSATVVQLIETFPARPWTGGPLALVRALPETGRTHQIRVHLAAAGLSLAVDPDYGDPGPLRDADGRVLLDRTPLHAARLALRHPATGAPLVIDAPMPVDLVVVLEALRSAAP